MMGWGILGEGPESVRRLNGVQIRPRVSSRVLHKYDLIIAADHDPVRFKGCLQ
jgi:hypothetical protein